MRYSVQESLDAVRMHIFQGAPFCTGLNSLCNDGDVDTVCGLGERLYQELVVFFTVNAARAAAIDF